MATTIFDLSNPSNYMLTNIGVTDAVASLLKTQAGSGLTKTSNFGNPSDFTYDSSLIVVASNAAKLKDQRPANATFYALFASTINGNWGNGSLTGTAHGGASIVGGKLDCTGFGKWVTFAGASNADSAQTGCVRLGVTPNYSGAPSQDVDIFNLENNDESNLIELTHSSGGSLDLLICDSDQNPLINNSLGAWSPTSGQRYEFELNYDLTTGATRLFIDGVQKGSTFNPTGTRTSAVNLFTVGGSNSEGQGGDFFIDGAIVFSAVQHTANYTPGAVISPTIYPTAITPITLTADALSGAAINAVTSITATGGNVGGGDSILWQVSFDDGSTFEFWNGSAWAISASSSDTCTLNQIVNHVTQLQLSAGTFMLKAFLQSNGVDQVTLSNVVISYNLFQYHTDGGSIQSNSTFSAQDITDFLSVFSEAGLDAVMFGFVVNGTLKYWNGSAWLTSDGSQAKLNTIAVIQANMETLISVNSNVAIYAALFSGDGSTTPTLTTITVTYDFGASEGTVPSTCTVYGFVRDLTGQPVLGAKVVITLSNKVQAKGYLEASDHMIAAGSVALTTNSHGFFSTPLIWSSQFEGAETQYVATIGNASVDSTNAPLSFAVPDAASLDLTTLLSA